MAENGYGEPPSGGYAEPPSGGYGEPPSGGHSEPPATKPYSLSDLGAHTKAEHPGFTFFPNGVTVNAEKSKVWLPKANTWAVITPNGISPENNQPLQDQDEGAFALQVASHFKPSQAIFAPKPTPTQQINPSAKPAYALKDIGRQIVEGAKATPAKLMGKSDIDFKRGQFGLGDLDPRAVVTNLGKGAYDIPAGAASWLGNMAEMAIPGAENNVLQKVGEFGKQQAESFDPFKGTAAELKGYTPGALGSVERMAPSIVAGKYDPTLGRTLFGSQIGSSGQETAEKAGVSKGKAQVAGILSTVLGGALGGNRPGAAGPTLFDATATAADRALATNQGMAFMGALHVAQNTIYKIVGAHDGSVLQGLDDAMIMGGLLGAIEAKGSKISDAELASIAARAKQDPEWFFKKYGSLFEEPSSAPKPIPTLGNASAERMFQAEPKSVRIQGLRASLEANQNALEILKTKFDKTKNRAVGRQIAVLQDIIAKDQIELQSALERYPATPLETEVAGPAKPEEILPTPEPTPEPPAPELVPAKASDIVAKEQLGQQDEITALREKRIVLANTLERANAELERLRQAGRRGSSEEWKEANAFVQKATADVVEADAELARQTGKTYEELSGEPSGVTPREMTDISPGALKQKRLTSNEMSGVLRKQFEAGGGTDYRGTDLPGEVRRFDSFVRGEIDLSDVDQSHVYFRDDARSHTLGPVVYDPITRRVIDGNHRVREAIARGEKTISGFIGESKDTPIKYLGAGIDLRQFAAERLGLKPDATYRELAQEVMKHIGNLGASARETAIRIMEKIKGTSRQVADAVAEELHKIVDGSMESQLGAVGKKVSGLERIRQLEGTKKANAAEGGKRADLISEADKAGLHGQEKAEFIRRGMSPTAQPTEPVPVAKNSQLATILNENTVQKATKEIMGWFGAGVGKEGEGTKGNVREQAARAALKDAQRDQVLLKLRTPFERLPKDIQESIIDAHEAGTKLVNYGAWNDLSTWAKGQYDSLWQEMNDVGIDGVGYVENYLTLMAKDPAQSAQFMAKVRKTLAGRAGFLEARKLANHRAMREAGIEPKYTNIADIMSVSMADQQRLIKAKRILNAEQAEGRVFNEPGPGLVELPSEITSKIASRNPDGTKMSYYATPGVATVLYNHMSGGFESTRGRNVYRAVRTWTDTSVSLQLAISAFHATFSMVDAQWSKGALALAELQEGNVGRASLELIKAMVPGWSQLEMFLDGNKLRKAMLSGDIPPELKDAAEAVLMGGGRLSQSEYRIDTLHSNAEASFRKALQAAQAGKFGIAAYEAGAGTIKTPIFLAELINKPLMEGLIPRMKVGAFLQMAAFERAKGPENLRERYQKAWQSVDDRLGQMVTDNMFWDKSATQIMRVLTRSLTWNLGTKNVAMGAIDPIKTLASSVKAGKPQAMSLRTNYLIMGAFLTAFNSVMMQYMLGQGAPKKMDNPKDEFVPGVPYSTDLFMPRIGGTDKNGKPKRVMVASYIKDMAEFVRIAVGSSGATVAKLAASKLSPGISLPYQALTNEDELGNRIGGAKERLAHAVPTPIGIGQVVTGRQEGKSWPEALAPAAGFPPAKKDLVATTAENTLRDKLDMRRPGGTTAEFQEAVKMGRLATAQHAGAEEIPQQMLDEGEISKAQFNAIKKNAKEKTYLAVGVKNRNLRFDDLYEVYMDSNSAEDRRKIILPELRKRYYAELYKASPSKKAEMIANMDKIKGAK